MRVSLPLLVSAFAVCGVMALPVVYLALRAGESDSSTWDLILRSRTVGLGIRTLGLAASVTATAVAVGVSLAWLTTRTDVPGRRLWAVLAPLPLVVPSYVGALILLSVLSPRGLLQEILAPFGVDRLPGIAGFPGAFLTLALFTYPYVYLLAVAGLRGQDPALEETARTLGLSRWATFRRVTFPLLRPSVAAGGLLVALYTLHDFGAVSLMRFQTFTQAIFLQYRAAFDRTPAAILSLMLVAVALAVLGLEHRARGRARYYRSGSGARRPLSPVHLRKWRWPCAAFCGLVALLAVGLPVTVLGYWLSRTVAAGREIGEVGPAMFGSLAAAAGGAGLTVLAATPIALLAARHPGRSSRLAERLTYAGFALPGIVVALAFVFIGANLVPALYQTLPLLLVAYVVLFLPQASEPIRAALLQVSPRVEEAGRVLGRSGAYVFRKLVAPLASRGAMVGFALVSLTVMKELPATLLLRPTGFETLATLVWTESSVGRFGAAAFPALLLVTLSAIPLYLLAGRVDLQEVRAE
jgi:iron(III) transport system permease protein